jgi:hypothetical protein
MKRGEKRTKGGRGGAQASQSRQDGPDELIKAELVAGKDAGGPRGRYAKEIQGGQGGGGEPRPYSRTSRYSWLPYWRRNERSTRKPQTYEAIRADGSALRDGMPQASLNLLGPR